MQRHTRRNPPLRYPPLRRGRAGGLSALGGFGRGVRARAGRARGARAPGVGAPGVRSAGAWAPGLGIPGAGAPGPLSPGGRVPGPRLPVPPEEPATHAPSCFFPARAVEVLLAPAAAAVLAVLGPGLTTAVAAPMAGPAAEHGAPAVAGRSTGNASAGHRGEPPAEDRAWPVAGPAGIRPPVLRGWDPPPSPWAAGHRGVDLGSSAGAEVRAAAPGRVAFAGTVAGRGVLTIELSHSGRPPLRTSYEPVDPTVRRGQHVTAGQKVAILQSGPFHCRAPCLHWGLRRGKTYLNPLSLLPRKMLLGGPSRLLPIFGVPVPVDNGAAQRPRPPQPPEPAAHARPSTPTPAALLGTLGLAAAALWALARLPSARSANRGGRGKEHVRARADSTSSGGGGARRAGGGE
ncbi:peptidoglycan DD-metalloendopeptidase family protein [Streptomyces kronopolitis]